MYRVAKLGESNFSWVVLALLSVFASPGSAIQLVLEKLCC